MRNVNAIKYLVLLLLLGVFACQSNKEYKNADLSKLGLHGEVKSFAEYSFLDDSTTTASKIPNFQQLISNKKNLFQELKKKKIADLYYYTFNQSGQRLEELSFHSDIDQNTISKYTYDTQGNRIEKAVSQFDEEVYFRSKSVYNSENKLLEQREFERDTSYEFKSTFRYDEKQLLKQEKRYDKEGQLFLQYSYKYDSNDNIIEVADHSTKTVFRYDNQNKLKEKTKEDEKGKIVENYKFEYDSLGNLVKQYHLDSWLEINTTKTFKYDENQKEIESSVYNATKHLVSKRISSYDSKGELYKQTIIRYDEDSDPRETTIKTFNEQGQVKQIVLQNELDTIQKLFIHSYDEKGNIVKIENSFHSPVTFREIEYH